MRWQAGYSRNSENTNKSQDAEAGMAAPKACIFVFHVQGAGKSAENRHFHMEEA
jgi:hypothetical protein